MIFRDKPAPYDQALPLSTVGQYIRMVPRFHTAQCYVKHHILYTPLIYGPPEQLKYIENSAQDVMMTLILLPLFLQLQRRPFEVIKRGSRRTLQNIVPNTGEANSFSQSHLKRQKNNEGGLYIFVPVTRNKKSLRERVI